MLYNYDKILNKIELIILIHEEDEYIYLLPDSIGNGSLLLEERADKIIIWNNDLNINSYEALYKAFKENIPVPVYAVYISTEKEYKAILQIGGKIIEFDEKRDYPNIFGSFEL